MRDERDERERRRATTAPGGRTDGPGTARSSGWCIAVYRVDHEPTTEDEERRAMSAANVEPEERVSEGGWIAAIPEELATDTGADIDVDVDGIGWRIEVPSI